MRRLTSILAVVALTTAFSATSQLSVAGQSAPAAAPTPQDHDHAAPAPSSTPKGQKMAGKMAGMGQKMMTPKATASDAELDKLVARMNAATGAEKTAAMAELLTATVERLTSTRKEMRESMAKCSAMSEAAAPEHKH